MATLLATKQNMAILLATDSLQPNVVLVSRRYPIDASQMRAGEKDRERERVGRMGIRLWNETK